MKSQFHITMDNPISIYLIDDHKVFTQSFESYILTQDDFTWKGAGEGDIKTINNILQIKPNIVLLDYHLAKTTGLDVLKNLKENGFDGLIVLLTMNRDSQVKEAVRSFGSNGFVSKETDGRELLIGLKELFNGDIEYLEIPITSKDSEVNHYHLTEQEKIVANFVCSGLGSEEISKKLNISVHTVNTHRRRILSKTASENFVQVSLKLKSPI